MFCHKCGQQLVDGAAFCSYCGETQARSKTITAPTFSTQEKKRTKSHKRIILIAAAAAVVLAVVIAALSFGPKGIEKQIRAYYCQSANEAADGDAAAIDALITQHVIISASGSDVTEVEITAPDMTRLLYELANDVDSNENAASARNELEQLLRERLERGEYDTRTVTVHAELDGNGELVPTYELTDAIYGGLLSTLERLLSENGLGAE